MKKNILILGATGETGTAVLKLLLASDNYDKIHILHYRQTPFAKEKKVIQHILNLENILSELQIEDRIDAIFCCIGSTRKKAGSAAKFQQIDRDFVLDLGKWGKQNNVPNFNVISSDGANATSGMLYLRTKGEMENGLQNLNFTQLTIFRPPLLVRKKQRFGEAFFYYPLMGLSWILPSVFNKYKPLKVSKLASEMIRYSEEEVKEITIVSSSELHHSLAVNT